MCGTSPSSSSKNVGFRYEFTLRIGPDLPILAGHSYAMLLVARSIQGIGSSTIFVCGLDILTKKYLNEKERGQAVGIVYSGVVLGTLVGPWYAGLLYDFANYLAIFLILTGLLVCNGLLHLSIMSFKIKFMEAKIIGPSLITLVMDPYILIATGAFFIDNIRYALIQAILPTWMSVTMKSSAWMQGS
ncbi:unnamed protein product [Didymodactylos carnosus]|uniref:Major facilitator superfamily (MFS) profile domain-containing protein n=1 Tax=Didymodactylos carnosus TaxID=1234261 RepID=A0A8S2F859_9BILA|nr:unnamed protein product [Didymodactylos carnosus]CAF4193514.1 unnamed protein product [Didymodactylos carnosus]